MAGTLGNGQALTCIDAVCRLDQLKPLKACGRGGVTSARRWWGFGNLEGFVGIEYHHGQRWQMWESGWRWPDRLWLAGWVY